MPSTSIANIFFLEWKQLHSAFFEEFLSCLFSLSKVQKTVSRLREKTSAWKWSPRQFYLSKTAASCILLFPICLSKETPFRKLEGRSHLPLADEHAGQQKAQIRWCLPVEGQIRVHGGVKNSDTTFWNVLFVCGRNRRGTNIASEVLHSWGTISMKSNIGPSTGTMSNPRWPLYFFRIYDSLGPQFPPGNRTRLLDHFRFVIAIRSALQL